MSGIPITPERARVMTFSRSYMDETLGLLVLDHRREEFESWAGLRARGPLHIGTPPVPYYEEKVLERLPEARLTRMTDGIITLLEAKTLPYDAIALPAERGSAWTLLYPRFSVVVPEGATIKIPLAYPVARRDAAFATFVDLFVDLQRKDGTLDALYAHWVLGHSSGAHQPRWSILRDVLHWVN
jgi:ABC-type amino acid transport substrate-binding protein